MVIRLAALVACLLPCYTATYEQTLASENATLANEIAEMNAQVAQMEERLSQADASVEAWKALQRKQRRVAAAANRMEGNAAAVYLRRQKRSLEALYGAR